MIKHLNEALASVHLLRLDDTITLVKVIPGNWLADHKAIAILLGTFGGTSLYREPWRPYCLMSKAHLIFYQGRQVRPSLFLSYNIGTVHLTVRDITSHAARFFEIVEEITMEYLSFIRKPRAEQKEILEAVASLKPCPAWFRVRLLCSTVAREKENKERER